MDSNVDRPRYTTFRDFYPFYLTEHAHPWTRRFHFTGTTLAILVAIFGGWEMLWLVPVVGYGFAWISHGFIEKNRPATFSYPLYSLVSDFCLWSEMIRGKRWTNDDTDRSYNSGGLPDGSGEQQRLIV